MATLVPNLSGTAGEPAQESSRIIELTSREPSVATLIPPQPDSRPTLIPLAIGGPVEYSTLFERFMRAFDMVNTPSEGVPSSCIPTCSITSATVSALDDEIEEVSDTETEEVFDLRRRSSVTPAEAASLPSVIGPVETALIARAYQSQLSDGTGVHSLGSVPVSLSTALRRIQTSSGLRHQSADGRDAPMEREVEPPTAAENPVIPDEVSPVASTRAPSAPSRSQTDDGKPPQRSLSRVIEQAEKAFPAIGTRDPDENFDLFPKFCTGLLQMICSSLFFGILGFVIVPTVLYQGAVSILSNNPSFTNTNRYRIIHIGVPATNVSYNATVAYEDIWTLQYGGFFKEFPIMDGMFHWALFFTALFLLAIKVAFPFLLYLTMYKRNHSRIAIGILCICPIGWVTAGIQWSNWVYAYENVTGPFLEFNKEYYGVLIVALLAWPFMALTKPKLHWSWPKFHGAIWTVFLPLISYYIAPYFARDVLINLWASDGSETYGDLRRVLIVGFINPLLITLVLIPIESVSIIVWNYAGFLQQNTLLVVIFPLSLFFHFTNIFNLLMFDSLLAVTVAIMIHALVTRALRTSISLRTFTFCYGINAITSVCETFARVKLFNVRVMQEIASVEFRAQLAVQDMGVQYISAFGAIGAAMCWRASSTISTNSRTDRLITYVILLVFVDLLSDAVWMHLVGHRTHQLKQPLIGGWVRRHAHHTAGIALSSLVVFAYIGVELSRTMCVVPMTKAYEGGNSNPFVAYVTMYCVRA